MKKRYIDMSGYVRKAHFDYFRTMDNPHVGVTVPVDVAELLAFCREKGISFFLTFLHAAALAADGVPEFRQRIDGDGIVEYAACDTSHTESVGNGSYCYCKLRHDLPFAEYIAYAQAERERCRAKNSIAESEDSGSLYFISCLPWLHYTSLIQPTSSGDESNPRITWGKYEAMPDGTVKMPVSVLCHHALVDGLHIAQFYEKLQKEMAVIISGELKEL